MRIFLFALLLACNSAPEPACKCNATTCVCNGADSGSPLCPASASGRGACTTDPPCMGCDGVAGFSCQCTADDAGHHWFCIGTGSSCANEPDE